MKMAGAEKKNGLESVATFIVDRRNLFFLIFIFAAIFSFFSSNWVKTEEDITVYLSEDTETRKGLTLMNDQFVTYGTSDIMVANISYERALELQEDIEKIDGVTSAEFDNTDAHFKNASALYHITYDGTADEPISTQALNDIKTLLEPYDVYVTGAVGNDSTASLAKEMQTIIIIAAVIILLVLLFTSQTYAEIPVLVLTFVAAAILNKGTNFMLGKISYISNSVAVVLQLALAIDYAIILCHRFSEERVNYDAREAAIVALSKAIPEISSSTLTTISGLLALITMHFKIGQDLAIVLIKSIFLSLLSVFILMPGLLVVFSGWMDKTHHKNFVPEINMVGKFVAKTKFIVPPIFAGVMVIAFFLANLCPYCYGNSNLSTPKQSPEQIARDKINNTFSRTNLLALVVPAGDYDKEAALLAEIERHDEVKSTQGLANTEAMNGYMLTERLTPRQFSELTEVDYEAAALLYTAHAAENKEFGRVIGGIDTYGVPLIDMFCYLHDKIHEGYVSLDADMQSDIDELYDQIQDAKLQLQTDQYSRMLIYLNIPEEGEETFAFLEELHDIAAKYYSESYFVGNTTSDYDLSSTFSQDNIIISILSALFVILVLMFTFNSVGLSILQIIVIQGSIWINFSFPYLQHQELFFLGYLIVNSIQMGANIDYAIVISSRYMELKKEMPPKEAMIMSLNQAFPTIITSGAIMACAGILIGQLSTEGVISAIGVCLGRGTIISIFLVMGVLPQILLLGDFIIEKTSFKLKPPIPLQKRSGTVVVNGRVRGKINGVVDANIHGVIKGEVSGIIEMGDSGEKDGTLPEAEQDEKGENSDE